MVACTPNQDSCIGTHSISTTVPGLFRAPPWSRATAVYVHQETSLVRREAHMHTCAGRIQVFRNVSSDSSPSARFCGLPTGLGALRSARIDTASSLFSLGLCLSVCLSRSLSLSLASIVNLAVVQHFQRQKARVNRFATSTSGGRREAAHTVHPDKTLACHRQPNCYL